MLFVQLCSKCGACAWQRCATCDRSYCGNCSRKKNDGRTLCTSCGSDKKKS